MDEEDEERRAMEAKRIELDRQALDSSIAAMMQTADFKRFLFWLLGRCGLYANAFQIEAATERYALGRQSIAHELLAKLDSIDCRLYPEMLLDMATIRELDRSAEDAKSRKAQQENEDEDDA